MSKLSIDQKTIRELLSSKKSEFLIPDYQRPYAWDKEKECRTLWDDIFSFAFPDNNYEKFNDNEEYFLGAIVTFKNENGKLEVIDGQQRITTLMLLLRAFYARLDKMKDQTTLKLKDAIGCCLWNSDFLGNLQQDKLKIASEVATDDDKGELLYILQQGSTKSDMKSRYADNYRFFQQLIDEFVNDYPAFFNYMPARILDNCILLPIEADSQDTALRIFSTLNNRGKPLSDADVFKAEFYKFYSRLGQKDEFVSRWQNLDVLANSVFSPLRGTPMDELFTRYMYYERAKKGIRNSTTEALRSFYMSDNYALLKTDTTLSNLELVAEFWRDVKTQSIERFSIRILKLLFILNAAPNNMWTNFVTVYFLQNRDNNNMLEDERFYTFLKKTIALVWTYAIVNPSVTALRYPMYAGMADMVSGQDVDFTKYRISQEKINGALATFDFTNVKQITKSILTLWAMKDPEQELLSINCDYDIEHIYARGRNDKEHSLSDSKLVETLGNKVLLEKRINIRASDYRFEDKKRYYLGYTDKRGNEKAGTKVRELKNLCSMHNDFGEEDIKQRTQAILDYFCTFIQNNGLTM